MKYETHYDDEGYETGANTKADAIKDARFIYNKLSDYDNKENSIYIDKRENREGELILVGYWTVSKGGRFELSNYISMNA